MSDPLSISAGAAGLVSLGLQVIKSLVAFYASYRGQNVEIERPLSRLEGLLDILQSLAKTVKQDSFQTDGCQLKHSIENSIQSCEEHIYELNEELQIFD